MGDGKSDRSGKRQRSSRRANKSSSDTELAQGKAKGRKGKPKEKWPLLERLTVDELVRYRRRRIEGQPRDNLGLCPQVEGEDLVSEYGEAFRGKSEQLLKESVWLDGSEQREDPRSKSHAEAENSIDREDLDEEKKQCTELLPDSEKMAIAAEEGTMHTNNENSKLITHAGLPNEPSLFRRESTMKHNDEFYPDTEMYSSYVTYKGRHRPELARRPTSLKMEGELDTMTEKCEKFIRWLNVSRPELMRIPTHLKLEGDFESSTENQDKYVPFVGARRPELLRRNTNLKLEGEFSFAHEYADEFGRPNDKGKLPPMRAEIRSKNGNNIDQDDGYAEDTEGPRVKDMQPVNDSTKSAAEESNKIKQAELKEQQQRETEMKTLIWKLQDLSCPPLDIPEYKDAYKDFPRERPKIVKPEDEIGRADGTKVSSSPMHKYSVKIDQDPEYKSKYIDYQRDRTSVYRKPSLIGMRSTLIPLENSSCSDKQGSKRQTYEPTSEVQSQYVPYGRVPRVETLKMPTNLRLEGDIDLEPEYKMAYCTKRESRLFTEPRMHRRRDRSLSASRRKENYWMHDNTKQIGSKNVAQDQDAFQIVNTRVHEDTMCGKPPPISRRGSRSSQVQVQRPMQSVTVECTLKERSTSPTYRLHVCNVDDEHVGFRRRRSPPFQSSGRICNSLPDHALHNNTIRPYSPSFGKTTKQHGADQSFVVLNNQTFDTNTNKTVRRKQTNRNYNIDGILSNSKTRTKASTNWMPPWYDSTNTA